jgi:hypothetical protein
MINIAIATHKNFLDKTLPILIPSLIQSNIDPKSIYVFVSGCDSSDNKIIEDINYYYLNHNTFELSPLIEIVDKEIESEYWFLIHDTCKVGPKFKELLYSIPENKPDRISLKPWPSMSIGLYRYDYLLKNKDKLLSIKNTDHSPESTLKWKKWAVDNEDYILTYNGSNVMTYGNHPYITLDYKDWYGSDIKRRTEYYPQLDLYKKKSNWNTSIDEIYLDI